MKYLILLCIIGVTSAAITSKTLKLPEYLKAYTCRRSDPNFSECVWQGLEDARPYFIKGIKELNVPPLDPFELPLMTVDRTLNDLVSIKAVLKNIRLLGGKDVKIDHVKANAKTMSGELRVTIPSNFLTMEYDVTGQLLQIPLSSKGFFIGNFSDIQLIVKGNAKLVKKDGIDYFRVDKIDGKFQVGDGQIKLIAKNPELQFGADLIANFYNANPRQVMDAVNPIFRETAIDLFRVVCNQILASIPASEYLPE